MPPAQDTTNTTAAPPRGPADSQAAAPAGATPTSVVCAYCGEPLLGASPAVPVMCGSCGGRTDPLSRQATQNEMGPWFVRDTAQPFRPGCRLETLERWVRTGRVTPETVLRGPSTHQNWVVAIRVPGIARLFGLCHGCEGAVRADEIVCGSCGTGLIAERDRQHLGLSPIRPLPGRGTAQETAQSILMKETAERSPQASAPIAQPAGPALVSQQQVPRPHAGRGLLDRRLVHAKRRAMIAWGVAAVAVVAALALFFEDEIGARFAPVDDGALTTTPEVALDPDNAARVTADPEASADSIDENP